ncbi:hypothetical protein FisN_13Hu168 [Fistulifera solaris]|jgi:hypothetical protein|uniref:Uncharacterized protein n=1 Tax=Fistulifera solaris TaxID=1519565 RepID=A0A1Z5KN22_FISSO|nr:hypothetical protein FisN_13Hu168 [Fistulifera solaris]|eukprot:GAX27733.1 hypothetical protein FisN_13Hu168 [Fistulifera solaris]
MSITDDTSILLGVIPSDLCDHEQLAHFGHVNAPTYQLLRNPTSLIEFDRYKHEMAIWMDNGTLVYVVPHGGRVGRGFVILSVCGYSFSVVITGTSDHAIVDTAIFFISLHETAAHVDDSDVSIDAYATPDVEFYNLTLTAQQSDFLASGSLPIGVVFSSCEFEDGGTAYVSALEKRKSSFGSLSLNVNVPFDDDNLMRLAQVDMLETLFTECWPGDLAFLPFSAKAGFLEYDIPVSALEAGDLGSVDILTKKLCIVVSEYDGQRFPSKPVLSLLRRIADWGQFVELQLRFNFYEKYMAIPDCVVQGIISAVIANRGLKILDLFTYDGDLEWGPHLSTLLYSLREHSGLSTLKVSAHNLNRDSFYYEVRQLLSHNRNIKVIDSSGKVFSDGSSIDELYSFNEFYRGSANLSSNPPPESDRLSLVATALVKRASSDFRHTALLLSNHSDVLHGFVQLHFDDDHVDEETSSRYDHNICSKRRRRL